MAKQNGTAGESFQKLFGFLKPYKLSFLGFRLPICSLFSFSAYTFGEGSG